MVDPVISLAFSVHSNPGAYAVLLGSGVSRAAGIPTGWEVVLDLIRKLAALRGADCEPRPEAWYQGEFGEAPDYGVLLEQLAKSPAERQQLLRAYFEPSPEDEQMGSKLPTKAHSAIASLVKTGHIKVIVTTNFDRLPERSLEAVGVSPVVISTSHAIEGALPLVHAPCTVVKLHGDYLDTRIKNTPDELAKYDRRLNRLLDRILDEYGLIVCGWSAEWDAALRHAMERCKNRRFTTYWSSVAVPGAAASKLIKHRAAEVVRVQSADAFFVELHEKVRALSDFDAHPLSPKVAVATAKRFLTDRRHRIELHDLVKQELERVMVSISDERLPCSGVPACNIETVPLRLKAYEAATAVLRELVITGCYWGEEEHHPLWKFALERLVSREEIGGVEIWIHLRRYSGLIVLYAGAIAALTKGRYDTLKALVLDSKFGNSHDRGKPVVSGLYPQALLDGPQANALLPGRARHRTPFNDYLFELLRQPLREYLPDDRKYDEMFDRFEILYAAVYASRELDEGDEQQWVPFGRFAWKTRPWSKPVESIMAELEEMKDSWPPIVAGLFSSTDRATRSLAAVKAIIPRLRWY